MATASARGAGTTVTGQGKSVFTLVKIYKASVSGGAEPQAVSSAGKLATVFRGIRQQQQYLVFLNCHINFRL